MSDPFPDIPIDALPKSLADVAERCGMETAVALVQHFGGGRVWIPQTWRKDHPLNIIGEDRAKELCSFVGPQILDVPKNLLTPEARYKLILDLGGQGTIQRDIARQLGLTARTIRRDLKQAGLARLKSRRATRLIDHRQIDLEDYLK